MFVCPIDRFRLGERHATLNLLGCDGMMSLKDRGIAKCCHTS